MMSGLVHVVVRSFDDPEFFHVVTESGPASERRAEKIIGGVLVNLGDGYFVGDVPACASYSCRGPVRDGEEFPTIAGVVHRACAGLEGRGEG